jgi:phospholipase/lecithinase/hemolysin
MRILTLTQTLVLSAALASATPFSNLYFFGDSLSDSGNISALALGLYPPAPYYPGRFSNGPVWAEDFAVLQNFPSAGQHAGMTLGPNFLNLDIKGPGNNYAIAGARNDTTGAIDSLGVPTGMEMQTYYYLTRSNFTADPNALYVLFGGGNDIRDAALLAPAARTQMVTTAAYDLIVSAYELGQYGARRFLVMNAPDIGLTPEARLERNDSASATAATVDYNAALNFFLSGLAFPNEQIFQFDTFGAFNAIYQDALSGGSAFGITNATTPCFAGYAGSTGADCTKSLFSDDLHPTALVHGLMALGVNNDVSTPALLSAASAIQNPEPATFGLTGIVLAALLWKSRRKACRS